MFSKTRSRAKKATIIGASAAAAILLSAGGVIAASSNTSLAPGHSTNVTNCTTGLALSAPKSPSVLSCSPKTTTTTTTRPPTTTTTTKPPTTTTTTIPPTTTTTTQPPAGGTCTAPITSITGPNATWNNPATDPTGIWWVDNDPWSGSAGPQTVHICNPSSWYATSQQTDLQGQVETYPNTEYDVGGRDNGPGYSTVPISKWNTITSTFNETSPSSGALYDASYDIWTNYWSDETMIWNQWSANTTDGPGYWGQCAEPGPNQNDCVSTTGNGAAYPSAQVTLGGVSYHFLALGSKADCSATGEQACEYIFFRDTQVTSGSVDLLGAWNYEVANGYAKASDTPDELEYGVEVTATTGTQTFSLNGLTFNLN